MAADASTGAQDPAARARLELERQANASGQPAASAAEASAKSAQQLQNQAKSLAAKQTTAPGPKVRYATSRPVKLSPPPPSAEEVARQERLAQIEREVERRRAERAGQAPAAVAVANKPQEISPVPPAVAGSPAPAPVVVSRETPPPSEVTEKQRNQSLREKLAADRARLAAEREAAEQQKAQQRQRREGIAFSSQTPPPVAGLASTPPATAPAAEAVEADRKARVEKVQSELDSKQFAQNAAGGAGRVQVASPAPSLPVLSLEQERKARELLRQTLAELEQQEAAANPSKKPKATKAAPVTAAPAPAAAPAPVPAPAPSSSAEAELKRQEEQSRLAARELIRQEGERVEAEKKAKAAQAKIQADRAEAERRSRQAQEVQAKAEAKAQADRAKAEADKARANAKLEEAKAKLHTRTDAERAAESQAKKATVKPAPAAPASAAATPAAVAAPTTKAEKLAALLKSYTRSESPISAEEYHRERARIISEP